MSINFYTKFALLVVACSLLMFFAPESSASTVAANAELTAGHASHGLVVLLGAAAAAWFSRRRSH